MNYNITAYSTALFSTWYFIEELGILFDAGDGITAGLLQKARKINQVFISHADRDHLTGLLQFNQLNARPGFPVIHYPQHCGSFPSLETFAKNFDPHVKGTVWKPLQENESVQIKDDFFVQAIRNEHVPVAPGINKSFGYKVFQSKTKLKAEFVNLPQDSIREMMRSGDKENFTTTVNTNLLTYSGDTPVDDYSKWDNSNILIHEATFLEKDEDAKINTHGNKHSLLPEVIKMAAEINIEKLILGHFSSRYSAEQIDSSIRLLCKTYQVKIPVHRILPGQIHRNILAENPINE